MRRNLPYRPCVGVMLVNTQGLVFVGRRRNKRQPEHVAPGHEWHDHNALCERLVFEINQAMAHSRHGLTIIITPEPKTKPRG